LLDHLFCLRGWVEGSLVHVFALQALWRIESIRVLRSSHRGNVALLSRSSGISRGLRGWRA
jgi:hypothetical protein